MFKRVRQLAAVKRYGIRPVPVTVKAEIAPEPEPESSEPQHRTDRQIAAIILMMFAESGLRQFAPLGFYDDSANFLADLEDALNLPVRGPKWRERIMRVCNKLEFGNVFSSRLNHIPDRQYIGEPRRQKEFFFRNQSTRMRLVPSMYPHYTPEYSVSFEIAYLLRRAFPEREFDENREENERILSELQTMERPLPDKLTHSYMP